MGYVGKPVVSGEFIKLDAITVTATDAFTLKRNSNNFYPSSANQLLVSLNGVTQAPGDAYTISGATITFDSALAATDVIDYILVLGEVGGESVPPDGSISTLKIADAAVTTAKLASGLLDKAIISSFTPITLSGQATGQVVTVTGNYFSSGATGKFVKVSDSSETTATVVVTNSTTATFTTTQTYPVTPGTYKLKWTNSDGSSFITESTVTLGLEPIMIYESDDHSGTGDNTALTGGWTVSSYTVAGSSGTAVVDIDKIRTQIDGDSGVGTLIGYGIRTTNAITIPLGYNRIGLTLRSKTGNSRFYLSSTPPLVNASHYLSNVTGGVSSTNFAIGDSTVTIDSNIADNSTGWYFYFVSGGGQNANEDQDITRVKLYAV